MAAGRWTSQPTRKGLYPRFFNRRPSLAVEVVLPEPWRPTRSTLRGRFRGELGRTFASSFTNSSMDDLDDLLAGRDGLQHVLSDRLRLHALDELPGDLEVDIAERRAWRTSLRVSAMFSSVSLPTPRRWRSAWPRRSVSDSNMGKRSVEVTEKNSSTRMMLRRGGMA